MKIKLTYNDHVCFFHIYKIIKYFEISRKKYSSKKVDLMTSNNFKKILQITKYKIIHV